MQHIEAAKIHHISASHPAGMDTPNKRHQSDKCEAHDLSASSAQQRSQHSAPAEFGRAGGATNEPASQRWQARPRAGRLVGAEPGAPPKRGYPRFLGVQSLCLPRSAAGKRGTPAESQSPEESGDQQKRWVAAFLRRTPARNDSFIRSSRPEITPKPRPSVVCAAKGNGDEGFHAARKGGGFCFRFCPSSCVALNS